MYTRAAIPVYRASPRAESMLPSDVSFLAPSVRPLLHGAGHHVGPTPRPLRSQSPPAARCTLECLDHGQPPSPVGTLWETGGSTP